ncbi:serine/threonine-protein kinase [Streptomyces sp. SKN60]|uniref:serine/threonine-protein kinase n=1 Tax=Streptomyces sp. SKN60 TaxID=2855506 RepID=UPI002246F1DD|nr:serine/threonine-protein kinase [Streptomyces sp. SKN60]
MIEHKLGEGGMGTVYLARSRGGRAVAVKVARPELAADPAFRARFRAEVAAARRVGGFHTAQVVDADPEAAEPWLATAYIPGPTLAGLVDSEGPLDEERLRALAAALAEALEAIHACDLVHRDLKPGNIVMAPDGPRVLDFGIARALESNRMTATGVAFGTPGYLAPEQALGEEVTGAADVFALGAVLVAAAGGSPFGGGTPMGLMYRSVHEAPDLTAVPEGLRDLVGRCLAKEPGSRPTPERILDELGPGAGAQTTPAPEHRPTVLDVPDPRSAPLPVPPVATPPTPTPTPTPTPAPTSTPGFGAPTPVPPIAPPPAGLPYTPTAPYVPGSPYPSGAGVPVPMPPPPPPSYAPGAGRGAAADFVAADSKGGVVIDAHGVTFQLREAEADFPWDEIAAVQHHPTRRGRVLRLLLFLRDGTNFVCEVDGRRHTRVDEWAARIDQVLAVYLPGRPPAPAPFPGQAPGYPAGPPVPGYGYPRA